jgi:hypothetical protein
MRSAMLALVLMSVACRSARARDAGVADAEADAGAPRSDAVVEEDGAAAHDAFADASFAGDAGDRLDAECMTGVDVDVAMLRAISIDHLRRFFGVSIGFDHGDLWYRDGVSSTTDCPSYDQSAVIYASTIDRALVPLELASSTRVVSHLWFLNGYRYIYLSTVGSTSAPDLGWGEDRNPLSACALFDPTVSPAAQRSFVRTTSTAHPSVPVQYFSDIGGLFCWGPRVDDPIGVDLDGSEHAYWADVMGIADDARASPLITSVEWSAIVYGFDWAFDDARRLPAATTIHPECLRTLSLPFVRTSTSLASLPSFGPPFGQGWHANPRACR